MAERAALPRIIVFAADIDDSIDYLIRRKPKGDVTVIWPGALHKLNETGTGYDRLLITAKAGRLHSAYVASILPRVRRRTLPGVGVDLSPTYEGLADWARGQVGDWS